jgi:hypothetical protein
MRTGLPPNMLVREYAGFHNDGGQIWVGKDPPVGGSLPAGLGNLVVKNGSKIGIVFSSTITFTGTAAELKAFMTELIEFLSDQPDT